MRRRINLRHSADLRCKLKLLIVIASSLQIANSDWKWVRRSMWVSIKKKKPRKVKWLCFQHFQHHWRYCNSNGQGFDRQEKSWLRFVFINIQDFIFIKEICTWNTNISVKVRIKLYKIDFWNINSYEYHTFYIVENNKYH